MQRVVTVSASDSDANALYGGSSVTFVDMNPRPVEAPELIGVVIEVIPSSFFHESATTSLKADMHGSFGPEWDLCATRYSSSDWVRVTGTIAERATVETDIRFWREMNLDTEPEQEERTMASLCFKRELSTCCYLNFYGLTRDIEARRRERSWQAPKMCLDACFVGFCKHHNLIVHNAALNLVTPFHFADVQIRNARCCIIVHSRSSRLASYAAH